MNDELNPDVRRLVDLTRQARTPAAADKRRIAERLAVPLAAGAAIGTATSTAKALGLKAFLSSLGFKVAAVVALTAAVTAVVVSQPRPSAPPARSAAPPTPSTKAEAPAVPSVEAPPASPPPASLASAPMPKAAPRVVSPTHELEEEAALLHQAQAAWRAGQSAQALQLASQHAQRFPRSQLANERDVLRVLSLCKLGQTQGAKQVGARLLRTAKGSPWYQSVADSCAAP
jgi:hypothetical protein